MASRPRGYAVVEVPALGWVEWSEDEDVVKRRAKELRDQGYEVRLRWYTR